jgi:F-type H+-transporting ATPase subunit delta
MEVLSRAARTYGQALVELAVEQGELAAITSDLKFAGRVLAEKELESFLADPTVPVQSKLALIDRLFGEGVTTTFRSFLKVVVSRRRASMAREIVLAGFHGCLARSGVEVISITTTYPLSEDLAQKIEAALTAALGVEIYAEYRVNPHLIGGMLIRRGDRVLDASVLGMLRQIGTALV